MASLSDELDTEVMAISLELRELASAADVAVADAALARAAGVVREGKE